MKLKRVEKINADFNLQIGMNEQSFQPIIKQPYQPPTLGHRQQSQHKRRQQSQKKQRQPSQQKRRQQVQRKQRQPSQQKRRQQVQRKQRQPSQQKRRQQVQRKQRQQSQRKQKQQSQRKQRQQSQRTRKEEQHEDYHWEHGKALKEKEKKLHHLLRLFNYNMNKISMICPGLTLDMFRSFHHITQNPGLCPDPTKCRLDDWERRTDEIIECLTPIAEHREQHKLYHQKRYDILKKKEKKLLLLLENFTSEDKVSTICPGLTVEFRIELETWDNLRMIEIHPERCPDPTECHMDAWERRADEILECLTPLAELRKQKARIRQQAQDKRWDQLERLKQETQSRWTPGDRTLIGVQSVSQGQQDQNYKRVQQRYVKISGIDQVFFFDFALHHMREKYQRKEYGFVTDLAPGDSGFSQKWRAQHQKQMIVQFVFFDKFDKITKLSDARVDAIFSTITSLPNRQIFIFELKLYIYDNLDSHSNILIYDKNHKTLIRFDPHGSDALFDNKMVDKAVKETIISKHPDLFQHYVGPLDFCQGLGPQDWEDWKIEKDVVATEGFCVAYSLWFVELYITNMHENITDVTERVAEIVKYMSMAIHSKNTRASKKIRDYVLKWLKTYDEYRRLGLQRQKSKKRQLKEPRQQQMKDSTQAKQRK